MSTFKKLFASIAAVMIVVSTAPVAVFGQTSRSAEYQDAYAYAFANGITTMGSIDAANLAGTTTRAQAAKMISEFAMSLGQTPDTSSNTCNFNDLGPVAGTDLATFAVTACQLGLMGINTNGIFNPNGTLSRAEFGTILSRVLWGDMYNGGNPFYINHLNALKGAGLMNDTTNPERPIMRGDVMLLLKRSSEADLSVPAMCNDIETVFACTIDPDGSMGLCPAACIGGTEPTDPVDGEIPLAGALNAVVASNSPSSMTIPYDAAGVKVASFTLTASNESDVRVDSLKVKRFGESTNGVVSSLAFFHPTLGLLSNDRTLNSEGEATVTLRGGLTIKKGQSETVDLVVLVGDSTYSNQSFQFGLTEVASSALSVNVTSARSSVMTISSVQAPELEVVAGSSVANVKVGQENVAIARFELQNQTTSSNRQDIVVNSITFEQTEDARTSSDLANFALYVDGSLFASQAKSVGNFVTFTNSNGLVITDGQDAQLEVRAEILDGVGKDVELTFTNEFYVTAYGTSRGPNSGVMVTGAGTSSSAVSISAGEIAISAIDAEFEKTRDDRKNVVLGKLVINVSQGENLEMDDLQVDIASTNFAGTIGTVFENAKLVNETFGGTVDLTVGANSFSASNEGLMLRKGKNTFRVVADIKQLSVADLANFSTDTFILSLNAGNLDIRELANNTQITDITPSALTWAAFDGTSTSVGVSAINLSSQQVVVGSSDVVAMTFDIESQGGENIAVEQIRVNAGANFASSHVSQVSLYKGSVDAANLLKSVPGTQIAAGVATFDNLVGGPVAIAADSKERFVVTVSFVNDQANNGDTLQLAIAANALRVRDSQNKLISTTPGATSPRVITLASSGTLAVARDNSQLSVHSDKFILGGSTEAVMALRLTANNEDMRLRTLTLDFNGNVADVVQSIGLYKNATDETPIKEKSIGAGDTDLTLENINYVVAQGSETVYVKVKTAKIGYNEADLVGEDGLSFDTIAFLARGVSSNVDATYSAGVAASATFGVVPVRVAAMTLDTTSHGGIVKPTALSAGSTVVGILKVTAPTTTNKWTGSNTIAKLQLTELDFDIDDNTANSYSNVTVERIGGSVGQVAATADTLTWADIQGANAESDFQLAGGQDAYFAIRVTVTAGVTSNESIQLRMTGLNAGGVEFSTDEPGAFVFEGLRMNTNTIEATKVVAN